MYVRDLDWNFHNNYYEIVAKPVWVSRITALMRILEAVMGVSEAGDI